LKAFPCRVDYINRFKSANEQKKLLFDLEAGKIDIPDRTHPCSARILSLRTLGLLIVDEEQKFG